MGQPKTFRAGDYTYALTYNGEIYNFRELREQLRKCGHTFETHSDTEVLLHAYLEWKEDCVQHLNGISLSPYGMIRSNNCFSTHHLGVKPLFIQKEMTVLFLDLK